MVAEYLKLAENEREIRQGKAAGLIRQAADTPLGPERQELLAQAVGFEPAATSHWLAIANTDLAMGYDLRAEQALKSARITIDFLSGEDRRKAVRDYSLTMAWRYYSLGRWQDGARWGERALKYDAGLAGHLVTLLNRANSIYSYDDFKRELHPFRPYSSGGNRRPNASWCLVLYFYVSDFGFDETDIIYWLEHDIHHNYRNYWRWRDFGLYCETNGAGTSAARYYEMAADGLKTKNGAWLTRVERVLPSKGSPTVPMPFWINPDGDYVTGSILAHLGYLRELMITSRDTAERGGWAEKIVAIRGRAGRFYPHSGWPILWYGEALVELDQWRDAVVELRLARDTFAEMGQEEPAVDRALGHLLLLEKKHGQAAPLIRKAVAAFPAEATCWADLGLVEAYGGHPEEALAAFNRALELDDMLAVAWYNRGLLKLRGGDPQAALPDIVRAAELVPDNEQVNRDLTRIQALAAQ